MYRGNRKFTKKIEKKPIKKDEKIEVDSKLDKSDNNNFIIMGRRAILEALKSNRQIDKIFVKDGEMQRFQSNKTTGSLSEIIFKAREKSIPIIEATKDKLNYLTKSEENPNPNHQGVAAQAPPIEYFSIQDIINTAIDKNEKPLIIICDKILDPYNLGAIIRTAEASGAHGIILPKRNSAPISETVYKASAGAIEHIKIARIGNISQAIDFLKKQNIWVIGSEISGKSIYEPAKFSPFSDACAIVIGSEGDGISNLVSKNCDILVSIPQFGKISSLNASVAAGILMFEAVRLRNNFKNA